jgi:hypothetical protein
MQIPRPERRRSLGFLDHAGRGWSCFLVSAPSGGRWTGHLVFRPADATSDEDEVVTAAIFVEPTEEEIHERLQVLGRPLVRALLDSALDVRERQEGARPGLRRWFRERVAADSRKLAEAGEGADAGDLARLRSLYASYRLDQVVHLIALVQPDDFEALVARVLAGRRVDFESDDQLQLAMLVVERIEALLPLPPFEVWVEDYLAHRDRYRAYAHTLHREGRLP